MTALAAGAGEVAAAGDVAAPGAVAPGVSVNPGVPAAPGASVAPVAYLADSAAIAQTFHDLIEAARSSIVLQMYLLAGNGETLELRPRPGAFPYAHTVVDWLVARKRRSPGLAIAVLLDTQTIDDPALTRRGEGQLARQRLAEAGIPVLHASLFGNTFDARRRFPPSARLHDGRWREVPPEAYGRAQQRWQTWHNLEDHRKNLVIDEGRWAAVTSHNFLDVAADWHENLFLVGAPAAGGVWDEVRRALALALALPQRLSAEARAEVAALAARAPAGEGTPVPRSPPLAALGALGDPAARPEPVPATVEVIDGRIVRPRLLAALAEAGQGDRVLAASTYFSDVGLLDGFADAAARGAEVRLLVDDCAGLPLEPVPSWFVRTYANFRVAERARARTDTGVELRIHPSSAGPMMHLKTAAFLGRRRFLIGGQANYTPNSFSGAWLETDLVVESDAIVEAFVAQFERLYAAAAPPAPRSALATLGLRALLWLVERTVFRF